MKTSAFHIFGNFHEKNIPVNIIISTLISDTSH